MGVRMAAPGVRGASVVSRVVTAWSKRLEAARLDSKGTGRSSKGPPGLALATARRQPTWWPPRPCSLLPTRECT